MKYGNRPLRERIATSPLVLAAALVLLAILSRAVWNIHAKASFSAQKLSQAQAELAKLDQNRSDLSVKVDRLSTDQGVEAEMRSKFRALRTGESVAVIVDDKQVANASSASTTSEVGWWGRFLRFFGW